MRVVLMLPSLCINCDSLKTGTNVMREEYSQKNAQLT
jgi:hypothetical protein